MSTETVRNRVTADSGSITTLFDAAAAGDRRATGRLLSVVERGGPDDDALSALTSAAAGHAHVVGITGAPGAGKSTLVGELLGEALGAGRRPAVLAIDPSSPITGGAILGDRVRMGQPRNAGAVIRSMATRGHPGGLALAVPGAVRLLDALGYDPVILETVGVGQIEIDIAGTADTTIVVVAPGWGDAVQANKAGLLEVADLFVINKADLSGSDTTRRDLELMLDLSYISGLVDAGSHRPAIVATTATDGAGVAELWAAISEHAEFLRASGELDRRRRQRLSTEIRSRLHQRLSGEIDQLLERIEKRALLTSVSDGRVSPAAAVEALYREFARGRPID